MSHSWRYGEYVFIGNSDLSGDITIRQISKWDHDETTAIQEINVPGRCLLEFVADFVVSERISKLEQMEREEVLGVRFPTS